MKPMGLVPRLGTIGLTVISLSGCGSIPVPGVLEPVFGPRHTYTPARICIVDRGASRGLRMADAEKRVGTGELFIREKGKRRRLPTLKDGGYAAEESWFRAEAPIRQYSRRYVKYGRARTVPASALTRGADKDGIPIFLDLKDTKQPRALYVPVGPGCVFQPYVDERYATRG